MGERDREEVFRRERDFFSSVLDSTDALVVALDREGRIVRLNRTLEQLTGYSSDEVKGRHFWELFLTPEEAEIARCSFKSLIEGKPACRQLTFWQTKDSGKRLISWTDAVLSDERGALSYVVKTGFPLGKGAASDEAWWAQGPSNHEDAGRGDARDDQAAGEGRQGCGRIGDYVAPVAEGLSDAVVITDTRGIIRYTNPAFERITGYGRDEALGRDLHILDSGRHDAAFYRELRETLRRSDTWNGSLIHRKKDGTLYEEAATIALMRNRDGGIDSYLSIRRDRTEQHRKESLDDALKATSTVSALFAGLMQEIGNPVNSVKMVLSMLRDNLARYDQAAMGEYLQRSLDELAKVEQFMKLLKKCSLFEHPEIQNVALLSFFEKLLVHMNIDFAAQGISLLPSFAPGAIFCAVDPRALQQVLLIVLSNAADACTGRVKPEVFLSVEPALGGMIMIRVADNGSGMDEAQQRTLFKPFFSTKPRALGLGLLTARRILARMNGTITITSRKGEGTVVDILIPQKASAN
ncbi:MAG: PAS domain S-box protein [Nitrospirota bacterium]